MNISIIIPTHSRPALLGEAVKSVRNQSYADWELIIVDDGSDPPVDKESLERIAGRGITLQRHSSAKGVAASKNAGIEISEGKIILFLDDDDLLSSDALDTISSAFIANPDLDCIFMDIEAFGKFAIGASRNQREAMAKLFSRTRPVEGKDLFFFDKSIVDALLSSVPLAFQRPAARRSLAREIGPMPENLIFAEPEWTILAAMLGKVALTKHPVSRWRVDGQNFASKPEMAFKQMQRSLVAREWLLRRVGGFEAELSVYLPKVRRALAMMYKDASYHFADRCRLFAAIKCWVRGVRVCPSRSDPKRIFIGIPYRLIKSCILGRNE